MKSMRLNVSQNKKSLINFVIDRTNDMFFSIESYLCYAWNLFSLRYEKHISLCVCHIKHLLCDFVNHTIQIPRNYILFLLNRSNDTKSLLGFTSIVRIPFHYFIIGNIWFDHICKGNSLMNSIEGYLYLIPTVGLPYIRIL